MKLTLCLSLGLCSVLSYSGLVADSHVATYELSVQNRVATQQTSPAMQDGLDVQTTVQDPVQMLQTVTDQIMSTLKSKNKNFKKNPSALYHMVENLIFPHVDFVEMARWVVGRNAWQQANAAEKQAFIDAFQTLVVRSYAHSLLEYTDYRLSFSPLRHNQIKEQSRIEVSSMLKGEGRTLHVVYRLLRSGNLWKVYDIVFENVSLIQGYRAQFADAIQGNGIASVIETLQKKNQRLNTNNTSIVQP